jgi:hypothetical protein
MKEDNTRYAPLRTKEKKKKKKREEKKKKKKKHLDESKSFPL